MRKLTAIPKVPPVPKKEINQDQIEIPLDEATRKVLTSRILLALDQLRPTLATGVNDSFGTLDASAHFAPIRTFLSFCCQTSGIETQVTGPFQSVVMTLKAMTEQAKKKSPLATYAGGLGNNRGHHDCCAGFAGLTYPG